MNINKMSHTDESNDTCKDTFDGIPHYKVIKMYLTLLGQYPQQTALRRKVMFNLGIISTMTLLLPMLIQVVTSLQEKDTDGLLEIVPAICTNLITSVKIINININRKQFNKLYNLVRKEWKSLKVKEELHILDTLTEKGGKVARCYRVTLLIALILFILLPMVSPFLDIVLPLNETRLRQQIFNLNYLVDGDKYFYSIYLHSVWTSIVCGITFISVDSVYMLITHHACGLFAICGNRIQHVTKSTTTAANNINNRRNLYLQLKECTVVHKRAIQFYELIDEINRNCFLFEIGMTMIAISLTAVQTVLNLHNPREALRMALFLVAQKFHLFFISLPGQKLVDYSLGLATEMYSSTWYETPVKMQKVLYIMQIRCGVPCKLSAGGLYDMNIENFGVIFKSSMSYFTMLMSLRE